MYLFCFYLYYTTNTAIATTLCTFFALLSLITLTQRDKKMFSSHSLLQVVSATNVLMLMLSVTTCHLFLIHVFLQPFKTLEKPCQQDMLTLGSLQTSWSYDWIPSATTATTIACSQVFTKWKRH